MVESEQGLLHGVLQSTVIVITSGACEDSVAGSEVRSSPVLEQFEFVTGVTC